MGFLPGAQLDCEGQAHTGRRPGRALAAATAAKRPEPCSNFQILTVYGIGDRRVWTGTEKHLRLPG